MPQVLTQESTNVQCRGDHLKRPKEPTRSLALGRMGILVAMLVVSSAGSIATIPGFNVARR